MISFPSWRQCLTLIFVLLSAYSYGHARVVYVDSTATAGAMNGTSWADAYPNMATALSSAVAFDSLWVANGTYYPGASGNNAANFGMKNNVVLLGGFEGLSGAQETLPAQRNPLLNLCVLSGDLDTSGTFSAADAYHVVFSVSKDTTSILDGFTITGGNASGPGANNRGGALFVQAGGIRVNNCILENNNTSAFGAAIYASSGILLMSNSFVRDNTSGNQGGGMYVAGVSMLRISNTVISNNTCISLGGGALLGSDDVRFTQCTFTGNSGGSGSAIYSLRAPMEFRNCIFWGDVGNEIQGTVPLVDHCIVEGGYSGGTSIINADPNFKDSDYRIFACSPAVDAGDSLLAFTTDLDGNIRPFDGDGDNIAKWDIGAFENQVAAANPAANPITGQNPACALGDDVAYQVTNNNFPASTYLWNLPGGGGTFDGRIDSNAVLVDWGATTGTYTIEVTEIDGANGCQTTNSLTLSLDTVPVVTFAPTGSSAICDADSLQLSAMGAGAAFQWYRNGTLIPGATVASFFAKNKGIFNVILTDGNGCRDSASTNFDLTVNPLPTVTFTPPGNSEICAGQQQTITGPSGIAFQWYLNGSALPSETAQSITTGTAGAYNLLLTDNNTCTDSAATALQLTVHPLPVVSINPTGTDTLCAGDSLALTATAAGDTAYQWYLNGSLLPAATTNPYFGKMSGIYNVILTDSNSCQDSSGFGHEILIADFEAPSPLCQNVTLHLDGNGNATLSPLQIDGGSTDNCTIATRNLSQSAFICADTGVVNVTLTVLDGASNSATCTANVTVIDSTAPVALCQNTTAYLDASGNLAVTPALIDGGSSDNCGIATQLVDQTNFVCADTGAHTIMLTVVDVSGSMAICSATLLVADSTRPLAVCRDTVVFLDAVGNASITLADIENGSSDNCGIATTSASQTAFTCADVPGTNVTLSVTDVSGNVGTCLAFVRVRDTVAPVAFCRDTIIYIDNSGQANLVPADVDSGSTDNCAIALASLTQTLFTCNDTGANSVTLSIQDADTNIATCVSIITVLDTIPPEAACSDTTFYLDSMGNAVVDPAIFGILSFDNCNFFDTTFVNVGAYTCADTGTHPVTLTVRDVNQRVDSCSGIVTIADSTAPFVQCRDTTLILDGTGNASVVTADLDAGTVDNCGLDTVFLSQYAFTCADVGINPVLLTATDLSGNLRQCVAQVTIRDTVAPVAACQDTTLYLDASGNASLTGADLNNGSTDNCLVAALNLSQAVFACQDTGLNLIQLSVIDSDSNVSNCTSMVTVLDSIAPTALCQNLTVYLDGTGNFALTSAMVDNGSADNCPLQPLILSQGAFTCSDTGSNTVSLTVTDPSGNTANCSGNILVLDTLSPLASCTDTILFLDINGALTITVNTLTAGASDNCGFDTTFLDQYLFICTDTGQNNVTATFIDPSGNTSTCVAMVNVQDSIAPNMNCRDTSVYLDAGGFAMISAATVDNGVTDACGLDTLTLSQLEFNCPDVGTVSVTLTATDIYGNMDSCIALVDVFDTIPPTVVCHLEDTVSIDSFGGVTINPLDLYANGNDVCGLDTFFTNPASFTCADIGFVTVTLTVQDPAGNADSCTTTVLILDTLPPVPLCASVVLQLGANGFAVLTQATLAPGSFDNCMIAYDSLSQDTFSCANFGFTSVTLILEDLYGNIDSCNGIVEVVDTSGISMVNVNLGGDTIICNSDTLYLDAGPGMASYMWSTGATSQLIFTDSAGIYWVDVLSPGGCMGTDTIEVRAQMIPEPNLRTESGESKICQNDSLILLVDSIYQSYLWSNGATTPTTQVFTGGNYSVQVTDPGGCRLTRYINIEMVPFPAPNPVISPASMASYCEGELLNLDAGAGYFAYLWNTSQTTQVITVFQPGAYWVEVWNGFGCHSISAHVSVSELTAPVPLVQQFGDTLSTATAAAYQWILNGNWIPGATNQTYIPTQTGDFQVLVTYSNGCSKISNPTNFVVGITDVSALLRGVAIYPNPTDGQLYLSPEAPVRSTVDVRVTDMYGREIMADSWRNFSGERVLDLSDLAVGIYLLELTAKDGRMLRKIVVE